MIRHILLCAALLVGASPATAQAQNRPFLITDNSFIVEEAFNQEKGVFQNIFTWVQARSGAWLGSFTQEWPAPTMTNQLSYTVLFAGGDAAAHVGSTLLNYRYQASKEGPGRPAFSPRASVILPTGRATDDSDRSGLQVNLPVSKQVGAFYLHGNGGGTWLHGGASSSGDRPNLTSQQLAGSVVWNTKPMLNLMLESQLTFVDRIREDPTSATERFVTVSPGVRGGWNRGDAQLILGAALPITVGGGESTAAALFYFSYELPFTANR